MVARLANGHIAVGVEDLDGTHERLAGQGFQPERPPYTVREGGSHLCFVRDPDGLVGTLILGPKMSRSDAELDDLAGSEGGR
jgi:catechol 2,3-dioxygenase-like lactoylglutathione lyase family enzyme